MTKALSLLTLPSKRPEQVMHHMSSQNLQTINSTFIPGKCGYGRGIPTESAAYKLTDSVFKSLTQKR
jgi:hypothetical protein